MNDNDSIPLHPEYGLNPSMEQNLCPICCIKWDTNGLLLLGRKVKGEAPRYTTTGYGLCPECTKKKEDGYVGIIGVDSSRCKPTSENSMKFEDAYRSGNVIHMKRHLLNFNGEECKSDFVFVEDVLVKRWIEQAKEVEAKNTLEYTLEEKNDEGRCKEIPQTEEEGHSISGDVQDIH